LIAGASQLFLRWRDQRSGEVDAIRRNVVPSNGSITAGLPSVAGADLRTMRVHLPVVEVPYLPRVSKEAEVADLIQDCRPVLIVGSSMVGKTRLAAEVAKRVYPKHPLLIPDAPSGLLELDKADVLIRNHVIWLDDLDRFFTGNGLTVGLVKRLAAHNVIVATLRAREWDLFQPSDRVRPPEWEIVSLFARVTLIRERDRPADDDLCRAFPDAELRERIEQIGIGEYVGAAHLIKDRIDLGTETNPLGYALVRGAADWRNAGITRGIPADLLPKLAAARLTSRHKVELDIAESYADRMTRPTPTPYTTTRLKL
jgi:hypothetical protein